MRLTRLSAALTLGLLVCAGSAKADDDCPPGTERREREGPERAVYCVDKHGKSQGPAIVFRPSGAKKFQGTYRDGNRHGWWKYWDEEGVLGSDVEYRNGKRVARRRVGEEATEVRSSRPGDPVHPCPDDAVVAGSPTNTPLEQWCERDRGDGAYVLHGPRLNWSNGVLWKREEFKNGVPHGDWIEWRHGRMQIHRRYADGEYHGITRSWHANGNRKSESEYDHGVCRRSTTWYEDGSPRDEVSNDEAGNLLRRAFWYDNGQKEAEEKWLDGKLEGVQRKWWRNGNPKSEKELRGGREVGVSSRWNFQGQLIERTTTADDGTREKESFAATVYDEPGGVPRPIARGPARGPGEPVVCPDGAEPIRRDVRADLATLLAAASENPEERDQLDPLEAIKVPIGSRLTCMDPRDPSLAEGPAADLDRSDRVVLTGSYKQGRRHGVWIGWGPDGERLEETQWENGQIERRVRWWDSGGIHSIRHYEGGKEHGIFATWYRNGARHVVGGMHQGDYDGTWMWYDESGFRYQQGGFRRGAKHGKWIHWRKDGSIEREVHYHQGTLHGALRTTYADGSPEKEGTYHEGKKHGLWTEWQGNEKRKAVHYRHGQAHGPYTRWRMGELEVQGQFERGRRVGTWTMYHPNGQRRAEGPYAWCEKPPGESTYSLPGSGPIRDGGVAGCKQGLWTYWRDDGGVRGTFMHKEAGEAGSPEAPAAHPPTREGE